MAEKTFTGASLEEALTKGTLGGSGTTIIGMVKASDTPGHVDFTPATCETWTALPTDMIEQAEQLGQNTCRDHSHPVFRITLKISDDPQAKLLASLLAAASQPGPMPQHGGHGMPDTMPGMQGQQPMMFPAGGGGGMGQGPMPTSQSRISVGGAGDMGGFGGLNAWGCWDSTCTTCTLWERVCNGAGRCWWICKIWYERPCERCIWPW